MSCLEPLTAAADLYRGDLLTGFSLPDCPDFDEWHFFQTEGLRQQLALTLERLVIIHISQGTFGLAIPFARRWLGLDPLHEPAHQQLMRLYAWSEQWSAALRQYETCLQLLEAELGVPPSAETEQLYQAIKAKQLPPPSAPPANPTDYNASQDTPLDQDEPQEIQQPDNKPLGRRGRYELAAEIGQGGFATVYRAFDPDLARQVALKVLDVRLLSGTDWGERFRREARLIAGLEHPRIVPVYDIGQAAGQPFIVMRLIEGPDLNAMIAAQGHLPWSEILSLIRSVAEGLDYAHAQGVLHRDLKPANILIDPEQGPMLSDFGLATLIGGSGNSLTAAGGIVGTPHYIAPEVWEGGSASKQSDIYALGCILYEMLTGEKLFGGESPPAVMMAHFSPLSFPETWSDEVPGGVTEILAGLLAKNPAERYGSAAEMASALTELTESGLAISPPSQEAIESHPSASVSSPSLAIINRKRHSLPPQPTPFIGRESELVELGALLTNSTGRLVTIVGPGGMGKTRLAVAVAENLLEPLPDSPAEGAEPIVSPAEEQEETFPNGIYFVPLAPLSSIEHIAPTMAEALGFQLETGSRQRPPEQQILDYLRRKRMLLVMDNFEHLLDGVDFVADIMQAAPEVRILVTSRERLHLHEEQVYPIQGLEFPDWETPEDAAEYTAVRLFIQSAQRVQPGFELVADDLTYLTRICRLVDGMPLGIELAASWVDTLPLTDIAAEIQQSLDLLETDVRNVPERHRSIRAVFDYSWQRMSQAEQEIFAQLSIFRGGFTRQAAQQISGASLRVLGTLTSKSHLQFNKTHARYQIHELLRQYAAEKLVEWPLSSTPQQGEDRAASLPLGGIEGGLSVQDRHSTYYAEILHQREAALKGPDQLIALAEIEADIENVRIAWAWAVQHQQVDQIEQGLESLGRFYEWKGLYHEGEAACRMAVDVLNDDEAHQPEIGLIVASLLIWQATFKRMLGHTETAHRLLQQSQTQLDRLAQAGRDTRPERAVILLELGRLARGAGNRRDVRGLYEQSLAEYEALNDRWGMARVLIELCFVIRNFGPIGTVDQRRLQLEQSEQVIRRSLALSREIGDRAAIVDGLVQLASTSYYAGRFEEFFSTTNECVSLAANLDMPGHLAYANIFFGFSQVVLGHIEQGRAQMQLAVDMARDIGYDHHLSVALYALGIGFMMTDSVAESQKAIRESITISRKIDNRHELANALADSGYAEWRLGNSREARRFLAEALQLGRSIQSWAPLWKALPVAALLLYDQGQTERALILDAFARHLIIDGNSLVYDENACRARHRFGRQGLAG